MKQAGQNLKDNLRLDPKTIDDLTSKRPRELLEK
jgi:hypothetical protein